MTAIDSKTAAITLGTEYKDAQGSSVIIAAKCGEKLSEVHGELKKKGAYGKWVKDSMPVGERSCQRFVELFEAYPDYAKGETAVSGLTDIISELNLYKLNNKKLEAEIRKIIADKKLGRTGISNLINEKTGKTVGDVSLLPSAIYTRASALSKALNGGGINIKDAKARDKWGNTLKDLEAAILKIKEKTEAFDEAKKAESKKTEETKIPA